MNDQRNPPPGLSGRQRVGIFLFALGVFPLSYGFRVTADTSAEFGKLIADENDNLAKVIRTANIKPD